VVVGEQVRHRRELDPFGLDRCRSDDELRVGNVLPLLGRVLGDHEFGEAGLVGFTRVGECPVEDLA
jgi:hypothetical protein